MAYYGQRYVIMKKKKVDKLFRINALLGAAKLLTLISYCRFNRITKLYYTAFKYISILIIIIIIRIINSNTSQFLGVKIVCLF